MFRSPRVPLRVRLSCGLELHGLERICPGTSAGGVPEFDGVQFDLNPSGRSEADFWIVYGCSGPREVCSVAPGNTLFVSCEPPSKKIYPRVYYAQFGHVKSYRLEDPHPRVCLLYTSPSPTRPY